MAYLPLSTANLPDPIIDPAQGASPEDHFNTVLWTGDGTSGRSITTGHQPDFVWTKERNSAINHIAQNSISGTGLYLHPNTTAAEQSATTLITSFDSNGFTVGNSGSINGSSDTYVAWSWKANGSGVTNTDGSITSTVSANTTSGFSIVSYSGNGTAGATVGHGLNQKLELFILKARNGVREWPVYSETLGATKFLLLNGTNAATTAVQPFNNTEPTNQVFTVGSSNSANDSSLNYIAYCFHSVEGFSKCGSYVGNGSTDGPFVYTGFQVKWVMYKRTDSAGDWSILDTERSTYNVADDYLYPHSSAAEASGAYQTDFLSNGFKLRGTNTQNNASGGTYIYMAFAENPFKYSNAR